MQYGLQTYEVRLETSKSLQIHLLPEFMSNLKHEKEAFEPQIVLGQLAAGSSPGGSSR